jgi:hypothetical protein
VYKCIIAKDVADAAPPSLNATDTDVNLPLDHRIPKGTESPTT